MGLRLWLSISLMTLVALGGSGRLAGQARVTAKNQTRWTPPHTRHGHPDMQGYWTNSTYTPLERPKELGTKEFYTDAEAVAYERQKLQEDNSRSPGDIHYDNVIWQGESYQRTVS